MSNAAGRLRAGKMPASVTGAAGLVLAISLLLTGCSRRPAIVSVPAGGAVAVEGTGTGWMKGAAIALKGRFAFSFNGSGQGRVEAFDPLGRTAFILITDRDREFLAIPSKKIYSEAGAGVFAARFLGLAMGPLEMLGLLSGAGDRLSAGGWRLEVDERGRIRSGSKAGRTFEVTGWFGQGPVPREVRTSLGRTGRITFKSVRFNSQPRPGVFETSFLLRFKQKTIEELEAIIDNEN